MVKKCIIEEVLSNMFPVNIVKLFMLLVDHADVQYYNVTSKWCNIQGEGEYMGTERVHGDRQYMGTGRECCDRESTWGQGKNVGTGRDHGDRGENSGRERETAHMGTGGSLWCVIWDLEHFTVELNKFKL